MRDSHFSTCLPARHAISLRIAIKLFTIALLVWAALACQPTYSQTAKTTEKPMKHYALIFYPSGTLTSEQLKQRQIEILEWAKDVTSMGIDIDPRAFATPLARLSPSASETVSGNERADSMFSNIVFFDAASEEQAMRVAKTHPGLRYGTTVEVREWTSPRVVATP
jgi:hypothetical protein